jgi:ADP-ribosylation factor 2-binding protein
MESNNSEIFRTICQLVTRDDFVQAQAEFYKAHSATFEDSDENKLEYTPIYESFVHLLENLIESKLNQEFNFSQESIDAFYEDFKVNWETYKDMDADAVETLFGFIDFERFKQNMINYKKGMTDDV